MISINLITEEVLQKRFDSLPKDLRDALTSERLIDVIRGICVKYHIEDQEKQEIIEQIVSLSMLGFLHPYDIASELNDNLQTDPRLSASIVADLDAKIFSSLKGSLDQNFSPLLEPEKSQETIPTPAKLPTQAVSIEEIQKGAPSPLEKPSFKQFAPTILKPSAMEQGKQPKIFPSITTAQKAPTQPTVKNSVVQTPSLPNNPEKELEAQIPKPVIIQENASFESNKKTSDFHINISDDKMKGFSNIPQPMPIKPAMIELGEKNTGNINLVNSQQKNPQIPKAIDNNIKGNKYEGEFSSLPLIPKNQKESQKPSVPFERDQNVKFFSTNPIQSTEKNRMVTELTSPTAIPSPKKTSGDDFKNQPSPVKSAVIQRDYTEIKIPPKPPEIGRAHV